MPLLPETRIAFAVSRSFAEESLGAVSAELRKDGFSEPIDLMLFTTDHTDAKFRGAPASSVVKLGITDLESFSVGRLALEKWQAFSRDDSFESFRFIALKLLNRNDLSGSLRLLDREVLLAASVMQILQALLRHNYSLVVFDVTPHLFMQYLAWRVAEWLGIRVLFFQPVGIAPLMIPRTSLDETLDVGFRKGLSPDVLRGCQEIFDAELRRLTCGQDPPYMETQKRTDSQVRLRAGKWRSLRGSVRLLFQPQSDSPANFLGHSFQKGIVANLLGILFRRSLQTTLRKTLTEQPAMESIKDNFALFAMHYEPERTSLPEGLPIDFQADAIAIARNLLPDRFTLYVKEHYSQQSTALRGFTGRTPQFYSLVSSFPSTEFLPFEEKLSDYLDEARFVFTLTGSVAIESVLRKTPVLYFGTPWWGGLPGTFRISRDTLPNDIVGYRATDSEAAASFLRSLVADKTVPGVGGESRKNTLRRFGALPDDFFACEAQSIARCVQGVLELSSTR